MAATVDEKFDLDVPAAKADVAIKSLSRQTGYSVIFQSVEVEDVETNSLTGRYSLQQALDVLFQGTALSGGLTDSGVITISRLASNDSQGREQMSQRNDDKNKKKKAGFAAILAGLFSVSAGAQEPADNDEGATPLEEIIVTGTNIRGVQNFASPVFTFDRTDFDMSGVATTEQFIRTIPQNFAGGAQSDGANLSFLNGAGGAFDIFGASAANLRGLGNSSTLTLLNGHRVAPIGIGEGVDLAMFPLSSIDRIEVLSDGASAIYGSDAVAGVVNIILTDNYDSAETRLQYGTVTSGDHNDVLFGQTFGHDWASGSILASYSYYDRTALDAADRSYTANSTVAPVDLLGEQQRHGALVSFSQELSDRVALYADTVYSKRDAKQIVNQLGILLTEIKPTVEQTNVVLGTVIDVGESWQFDVSTLYGKSDSDSVITINGAPGNPKNYVSDLRSADLRADGPIFGAPGGDVKLAVGGQLRVETFTVNDDKAERNISSVFGEVFIPFVSDRNASPGLARLNLTLAGRFEDYSDFGNTTNPKIGVLWSPTPGWNVRGSWGTSFRAPLLFELDEAASAASFIFLFADTTGTTATLTLLGNSSTLVPEEATTWTVGTDIHLEQLSGFEASLTYFNIDYTDRIETPIVDADVFNALLLEDIYSAVITRNPDIADVDFLVAQPGYLGNFSGLPLDQVGAIVDNRVNNLALVKQSGIDFNFSYDFGQITLQVGGVYLLENENQFTASSPVVDVLNTTYRPADLNMRNSLSWSRKDNRLSTALFVNYVSGYTNNFYGGTDPVDSWTTADLNLRYVLGGRDGGAGKTSFAINVRNIFDEDPPFVANPVELNFDATNANAFGRFVSLQIKKEW